MTALAYLNLSLGLINCPPEIPFSKLNVSNALRLNEVDASEAWASALCADVIFPLVN